VDVFKLNVLGNHLSSYVSISIYIYIERAFQVRVVVKMRDERIKYGPLDENERCRLKVPL
jgi:hypothetical protein